MNQQPEHSIQGYLTRLPTYKLELILNTRNNCTTHSLLTDQDYELILEILHTRPDSLLFLGK